MPDDVVSVEFRDGERWVPAHVSLLMRGLETHTMTYEQAVKLANQKLAHDYADRAQKAMINTHFRTNR